MCAPMIGAAVSAIGSLASGMAQASMSKYNAKVAKLNADAAVREGMAQAGATRDEFATVQGQQRAGLAKAGVDVNSGTAAILQTETVRREEHAAATDIWRGRSEQTKYLNQETLLKAEAKAQKTGAIIGAFSNLIGGIPTGGGSGSLKLGVRV